MSFGATIPVRDGKFDVVVAAGPRLVEWPSVGARTISSLCAEMGLEVGVFGGESLAVRGVIPLPATGGIVIIEDSQRRIHRVHARAVVRISAAGEFPDPFPGWMSQGLIPISTALRLKAEGKLAWDAPVAILGTSNRALRFASTLLELGSPEIWCIETHAQWGAKRFSGWEVERRRFESLGGRLIEAKPVTLTQLGAMRWEFRVQDAQGVRVLDVSRVISAGPFRERVGVREHPPGSFLFELENTAAGTPAEDMEGWVFEKEHARVLGAKIVRSLATDLGPRREEIDQIYRQARGRLKRYLRHREEPFTPQYQGKWIAVSDARRIRAFSGVPQKEHHRRPIASIECFEEIPCNLCHKACPESAIQIGRVPRPKDPILNENACTACGICLDVCPSASISLLEEREDRSMSTLTLTWRGPKRWAVGEFAQLLNRRGEGLGSARVLDAGDPQAAVQHVQVEVPTHLIWDARGIRRPRKETAEDDAFLAALAKQDEPEQKVEITFNGERRIVRAAVPVSLALFEVGQNRPDDVLFCADGSCGLCQVLVDGVKKLACQNEVHRGMAVKLAPSIEPLSQTSPLCPCLGVTSEQVIERMKQAKLSSPDAVISVTHVGEGKCHGLLCMDAFKRLLQDQGLDASQWIDWRFPWSEWTLSHN